MNRTLRALVVTSSAAALLAAGAAMATASPLPQHGNVCTGGDIAAGSYRGLTVTGQCTVPDGTTVTVRGNLVVEPGATFDAETLGTVHITGNVLALSDATFALGCNVNTGVPQCTGNSDDRVDGSILATGALTLKLDGDTIRGNVTSLGGGDTSGNVNFPIKDNKIDGNVDVIGWRGTWFGFIRNVVHGSVLLTDNVSNRSNPVQGPDSNEVNQNRVSGSLACYRNDPAAQYGDSTGDPINNPPTNKVHGAKLGECAHL